MLGVLYTFLFCLFWRQGVLQEDGDMLKHGGGTRDLINCVQEVLAVGDVQYQGISI